MEARCCARAARALAARRCSACAAAWAASRGRPWRRQPPGGPSRSWRPWRGGGLAGLLGLGDGGEAGLLGDRGGALGAVVLGLGDGAASWTETASCSVACATASELTVKDAAGPPWWAKPAAEAPMTASAAVVVTSGRRRAEESTYGLSVAAPRVLAARSGTRCRPGAWRSHAASKRKGHPRDGPRTRMTPTPSTPGGPGTEQLRCSGVMKPRSDLRQP